MSFAQLPERGTIHAVYPEPASSPESFSSCGAGAGGAEYFDKEQSPSVTNDSQAPLKVRMCQRTRLPRLRKLLDCTWAHATRSEIQFREISVGDQIRNFGSCQRAKGPHASTVLAPRWRLPTSERDQRSSGGRTMQAKRLC